jgi:hypothetical protein
MKVVLLRVGIDTGCGGIHSPLFEDGRFEFLPIPDGRQLDERTYGNTLGLAKRNFSDYFPAARRAGVQSQSMHVDPEFNTFTYGDPTPPKRRLSSLQPGDLLVFYAGLQGWNCDVEPALYLVGFFRVKFAGIAAQLSARQIRECSHNFHVRHHALFCEQRDFLVLVKGEKRSRLWTRACKIGERIQRPNGSYWQVITPQMEKVFGRFGGIGSLQRSSPRWVEDKLIKRAANFVLSLE